MSIIQNPVLRGFNPDPSILCVGEDYYIATSTFEWFPGVQIHHSRDLVHWELIAHPLERLTQLNMLGEDNSCGVWAPCLSYDNGVYYLIYTDVKSFIGSFKDTHNYLVTATDIRGPWSEPVYLNASGFDPSLFHDRDGRKYLVNMLMDHTSFHGKFAGIVLQEYSPEEQKLIGPVHNIFPGTPAGLAEGPHLYFHDGYYYLMIAEGGTGYNHAVTVVRSQTLTGPYEMDPQLHLLTTKHQPWYPIQKAGHGSLIHAANGRWYVAHLCGRPVGPDRRCILGRETSLQEVVWEDGWLRLANHTNCPSVQVEIPGTDAVPACRDLHEDFDQDTWSIHLQSLRVPLGDRASLSEKKGWLRLTGAESLNSKFHQSLLAHRQQAFCCQAETKLSFHPENFQQMAGLTYFYNTQCYYYLYLSRDAQLGRVLSILCCDLGKGTLPLGVGIPVPGDDPVFLRVTVERESARFSWSVDGVHYQTIGGVLDATILSDDYFETVGHGMFTGAFFGICCQDLSGRQHPAYFDYFDYKEFPEKETLN